MKLLKAYRPDGSSRAIWQDRLAVQFRAAGVIPRRASNVEVIEAGPHRGRFHVDLSRLSDLTGDPRFAVCLTTPFDSHAEAVRAEVAFLEEHWVTGE